MSEKSDHLTPTFRELWGPFLRMVPIKFRPIILQKENEWSRGFLKASLALWGGWYALLIILSDLQKADPKPYILIRASVIALSSAIYFYLKKSPPQKTTTAKLSLLMGFIFMMSYVLFSFLSQLPLRTTWISVLPAAFVVVSASSGRGAIFSFTLLFSVGLVAFRQPINSIFIVSDTLFGLGIILGGLTIKFFWLSSSLLTLQQEETERTAIQNEIKIYEAIETFVPKALRTKIKAHLSDPKNGPKSLRALTRPTQQLMTILYSDYRNYSERSSNIAFVEEELIESSSPIIRLAEENDGMVQNRGDSLLVGFLNTDSELNIFTGVLVGLLSSRNEFQRILKKGKIYPDRHMIISSGEGIFCSLGTEGRNEITIAGKPANLAARIDEITKDKRIKSHLERGPAVICDFATNKILKKYKIPAESTELDLRELGIDIRSYADERRVYVIRDSDVLVRSLEEMVFEFTKSKLRVA